MSWFAKHTSWLYSETQELSNNSIYKERYQFLEKILISTGDVLVHKSKTEYHPILIVYPEPTPYVPPTIYALQKPLNKEMAKELAALNSYKISEKIKNNIKFFDQRHQNANGSICFIETGDLHSENAEVCPFKDIIKRLRSWFSGKIPKDSLEIELFHHFPSITRDLQYLIPDLFFKEDCIKGTFYAGLSGSIEANLTSPL